MKRVLIAQAVHGYTFDKTPCFDLLNDSIYLTEDLQQISNLLDKSNELDCSPLDSVPFIIVAWVDFGQNCGFIDSRIIDCIIEQCPDMVERDGKDATSFSIDPLYEYKFTYIEFSQEYALPHYRVNLYDMKILCSHPHWEQSCPDSIIKFFLDKKGN